MTRLERAPVSCLQVDDQVCSPVDYGPVPLHSIVVGSISEYWPRGMCRGQRSEESQSGSGKCGVEAAGTWPKDRQ